MLVRGNPSSVINTVFTVTETSTAGLNSTAQVRVTSDPKGGMGLGMLLDNATEVGAGTANYDRQLKVHLNPSSNNFLNKLILSSSHSDNLRVMCTVIIIILYY